MTLAFTSVVSIRGVSIEPICVVFETVGMIRGSAAMVTQSGEAGSIVRKALATVCLPDTMAGIKTVCAAPGGRSSVPETVWMSVCPSP